MKKQLIFISEHNPKTIGGTVTFQKNLLTSFAKKCKDIIFIYPNSKECNFVDENSINNYGIKVNDYVEGNDTMFNRNQRIQFVKYVNSLLHKLHIDEKTIVHILFGWYLFELIEYNYIHNQGAKIGVTIHNIPPEECGTSWLGDSTFRFGKDLIKKLALRILTFYRFIKSDIDFIVVPSSPVKNKLLNLLSHVDKKIPIKTVQHGVDSSFFPKISNEETILLTVGGIVPSKRQIIIPSISKLLIKNNLKFQWNIVGPIRNQNYYNALVNKIENENLSDIIKLHSFLPYNRLVELYNKSSIYVHTGKEEGFCFTGIDAVLHRLPIIAIEETGELPMLIEKSSGVVVDGSIKSFANAILRHKSFTSKIIKETQENEFLNFYSWDAAADSYLDLFDKL